MKVQIEDNLFIESDSMQFIIREYTGKKTKGGKDRFITHGYFVSLAHAVRHIVNMKVKQSTAQTLAELVQEIERIQEYIHTKISI